ncbi:MAG TPA: DUF916 and DUF3324 domain-containing protein [Cerasibacillus sp.]|uniref:DUF916 and DUF3324 domain-containing protein n=1 Tax=Cerasibacillus sp. TaxID=2498711 RepID=UPI002F3FA7D6
MQQLIKICIAIILVFCSIGYSIIPVFAKDNSVGYSVRAIIPDNQIDKNQTYFDLKMKPKQKQTLYIEIFNSTNEPIEINCHITNAVTNRNGLIDYTNLNPKLDDTLLYPMTEIAKLKEDKVSVPAGQTRVVPVYLNMPTDPFDGVILGGIYFEKNVDEKETKDDSVQITNKYAYVIGLKLTETNRNMKPELHLKSVEPSLVNYRHAIIAPIQNRHPVIIDHLKIDAKVLDARGQVVHEQHVKDYRMAPNSTMEFVMDWNHNKFHPGTYTLILHASNGKQEWKWEEAFEIAKAEAKQLNKGAVQDNKDMTIYMIIGLSIVIIILFIILIKLKKENNQLKKRS